MLGERLRERVDDLVVSYAARMRSDPRIPNAKDLPQPLLEDHALSFLGDLFQSIVVVERSELKDPEETMLLRDGTHIQRLVAELHGRQRYRMGWTPDALRREYEILNQELAAYVQRTASTSAAASGLNWALDYLQQLLKHAQDASFAAYGVAAREGEGRANAEEPLPL